MGSRRGAIVASSKSRERERLVTGGQPSALGVVYRTSKVDEVAFPRLTHELGHRLDTLATTTPIAYRRQNHGDYVIPAMTLRDDLAPGREGFDVHVATPARAEPDG
ncbi:MAG: hypothetical protein KF850_33425 [Labilithrix sp.]|nr:hypothetical protein [Labilithrix sp.]